MLVEKFQKDVNYSTFFAPCEIMRLTNGFMEFKKEFWLLQAPAILKHSAPLDMQNVFENMLLDFSGILTMLKGKLFLSSKRSVSYLLLLILMYSSKKVASTLLPFSMHSFNSSGNISLELLSNIPASLIAFKSSVKRKTFRSFPVFIKSFFCRSFIHLLSDQHKNSLAKNGAGLEPTGIPVIQLKIFFSIVK